MGLNEQKQVTLWCHCSHYDRWDALRSRPDTKLEIPLSYRMRKQISDNTEIQPTLHKHIWAADVPVRKTQK